MARAVGDADMDDVLASLRRLVMDGAGPATRPRDRLVLTPALRVDPEPAPPGEAAEARPAPFLLTVPAPPLDDPGADAERWATDAGPEMPVFRARRRPAPELGPGAPAGWPDDAPEAPDDAALRALIREVLNEELAGALGERITRNLRRLVRREVYRVLASQDD